MRTRRPERFILAPGLICAQSNLPVRTVSRSRSCRLVGLPCQRRKSCLRRQNLPPCHDVRIEGRERPNEWTVLYHLSNLVFCSWQAVGCQRNRQTHRLDTDSSPDL